MLTDCQVQWQADKFYNVVFWDYLCEHLYLVVHKAGKAVGKENAQVQGLAEH